MSDGSLYQFNAAVSKAAIGSAPGQREHLCRVCELLRTFAADLSRGVGVCLAGRQPLTPLPKTCWTTSLKTLRRLSSCLGLDVGMGIAGDPAGSIYFVTGIRIILHDADGARSSRTATESLHPISARIRSSFTPGTRPPATRSGAPGPRFRWGGITVLPTQPGALSQSWPGGREGRCDVPAQSRIAGRVPQPVRDYVLGVSSQSANARCGESYFQGADGVGRWYRAAPTSRWSGGQHVIPLPHRPGQESRQPGGEKSGQDADSSPRSSSNGTTANTQIIWR